MKRQFSKEIPRNYWEKHSDYKQYLNIWYDTANILKEGSAAFNIKGNSYRIITKMNSEKQWMYIRFIGTRTEYDKIYVETI